MGRNTGIGVLLKVFASNAGFISVIFFIWVNSTTANGLSERSSLRGEASAAATRLKIADDRQVI